MDLRIWKRRKPHLPRSLRRAAVRARTDMEGRLSRVKRWPRIGWSLLKGPWGSPIPIAVAFAGVWVAPKGVFVRTLASNSAAQTYLTTIWQVEAVALALSVAVVIFGFQALSVSRHANVPGSVSAYTHDNGLFAFLGVAVSGLLLPGLWCEPTSARHTPHHRP